MKLISSILRRATTEYAINHPHIRMKYKVIGAVAFVGFPAYFVIWKFIFEQPYENLWLRLLGSAMSLPLLLEDYFSETIKKIHAVLHIFICNIWASILFYVHDVNE